jgi:pyridoxamine 5'-phosphate oxidase
MTRNIADLREEYHLGALHRADLHTDPFEQFGLWFDQAGHSGISEPNAMILSTVKPDMTPSSRIVLLKDFSPLGFTFFTNYESQKGQEIAHNPNVSLLFPWYSLERQVRIEGLVTKVDDEESDAYFATRPEGSRLGAWVSAQSEPIASRNVLEIRREYYRKVFHDGDIPRPPQWGGYRVWPELFEFWQGRADRLHDRFCYTRKEEGWTIRRLAP